MKLSDTHLRYLYVIYGLSKGTPAVRSASVAEQMGVSRPSVARMLGILMEKDLIAKELYGKVRLTDAGLRLARRFDEKVKFLLKRIPKMGLHLSGADLTGTACILAAALPETAWGKSAGHFFMREYTPGVVPNSFLKQAMK